MLAYSCAVFPHVSVEWLTSRSLVFRLFLFAYPHISLAFNFVPLKLLVSRSPVANPKSGPDYSWFIMKLYIYIIKTNKNNMFF
jgi:hypothetical protein